jgi:hypothetical protein
MEQNREENEHAEKKIVLKAHGNRQAVEERVNAQSCKGRIPRAPAKHHIVMSLFSEMKMSDDRILIKWAVAKPTSIQIAADSPIKPKLTGTSLRKTSEGMKPAPSAGSVS